MVMNKTKSKGAAIGMQKGDASFARIRKTFDRSSYLHYG